MERLKIEVKNDVEAAAVQEILFKMGYSWQGVGKNVFNTSKKYFYTDVDGCIMYGSDEAYFKLNHSYRNLVLKTEHTLVEVTRDKITIGGVQYYKDEFEEAVKNLQPAKD
jgi:hypothetical protein